MNFTVRFKNPWFWVGILGVIFTAMGVSPESITSWEILKAQIFDLLNNPYMLFSVFVAVLGVFIDPTTGGVKDTKQAPKYSLPKRKV